MASSYGGFYRTPTPTLGYTPPPPATTSTTPYAPPPPPPAYTLPPPPPPPTLPTAPANTFLQKLLGIVPDFQNASPFPQLPPEVAALLATQKDAAMAQFDVTQRDALDQQLASLFGRGVERSTIAADEAGRLSTDLGAARAGIEGQSAAQMLAAMQYAGQFGQSNLGALANVLGSGASLAQNEYRDQINAMLQQYGINMQGYGAQTGNMLQQQGLSQQYQLAQQQMQQSLLQSLLGNIGSFTGGLGGSSGGSGGFNFGGFGGGGSTSGSPSSGVFGYYPGAIPEPNYGTTGQDVQQAIYQYIIQLLGGLG